MIRIDGKSFHTYTKSLEKPFDFGLMEDMAETTKYLCSKIQGAKMGYTQSDEISILLTDYDTYKTDAWFDGQVQKIVSVAASMATAKFNQLRLRRFFLKLDRINDCEFPGYLEAQEIVDEIDNVSIAEFDARVYTLPDSEEVVNYFIWRQQDATRNSIAMAAQAYFSHSKLQKVNTGYMQDMLMREKNINWNNYPTPAKRGWGVKRQMQEWVRPKDNKSWKPRKRISLDDIPNDAIIFTRNSWTIDNSIPILTKDRDYVLKELPTRKEIWKN